jgi:hypothetical protein
LGDLEEDVDGEESREGCEKSKEQGQEEWSARGVPGKGQRTWVFSGEQSAGCANPGDLVYAHQDVSFPLGSHVMEKAWAREGFVWAPGDRASERTMYGWRRG